MRKLYAIPAVVAICLGMGSAANAQLEVIGNATPLGSCAVNVTNVSGASFMGITVYDGGNNVVALGALSYDSFDDSAWSKKGIAAACEVPFETLVLLSPSGGYDTTEGWGIRHNDAGAPKFYGFMRALVNEPSVDPTPASGLEEAVEVIAGAAARSLQSTISANRGMLNDARDRFIESGQSVGDDGGVASRNDVDFDVDGTFAVNGKTLSTSGTFFQQTGNYEGTQRRLFFGDFDVQTDGDTGSTTATLTGRMAWEQMVSNSTLMGYFIGGELAYSNIDGVFEGNQDRIGVTIGTYTVHQLAEQVYLDGFLTFGAGRNNLEMANDVLELESDYTTRTATIGAALSGVYDYGNYGFRPELAFSYGHTWIGNVGFTGRADGLVDDTLSLDAGDVSIANLTLRPEMVWALDGTTLAKSNSQLSFAPRLICEIRETVRRTENCGGGAEFGLSRTSEDGLSTAEFRVSMDRVGDSTRSSLALNLQHRF